MLWSNVQQAYEKYDNAVQSTDLGNYEEAENLYWDSLEIHPTPESYVNISKLFILQEKYEDAELICRRAIKTSRIIITDGPIFLNEFDVFSIAYTNLGIALYKQGKIEEAENAYSKAILFKIT